MLTAFFIVFAVLLLLRFPIFLTFYISSFFAIVVYMSKMPLEVMVQTSFSTVNRYELVAVPYFILTAAVMSRGGMAKRLIDVALSIVGSIKGSLAVATTMSAIFFGALSGSSPATVAALGRTLYPALLEKGYSKTFALGLITADGAIAILIPPSITMMVYASIANASVGKLFTAGVLPGILLGTLFIIYSVIRAIKDNVPTEGKFSWQSLINSSRRGFWTLGVPVIILGGIYSGVFTPTEAAAVSSVYAIVVAILIHKEITWKDLWEIGEETVELTAQIFIIVAASGIFSWVLTIGHAPKILTDIVATSHLSYVPLLLLINLMLLIAGMFMHPTSITIIFTPLLMPIIKAMGIDPIHFGIILTMNIAIGMYSPPFGLNLFVSAGIFKESISPITKGVIPFLLISLLALAIVTFVPQLSLFLTSSVK